MPARRRTREPRLLSLTLRTLALLLRLAAPGATTRRRLARKL